MARKSLEDRIREAGRKKREKEMEETAELLNKVVSVSFNGNNENSEQKKSQNTPDLQNDRESDREADRESGRPINRPTNIVTERHRDHVSDRESDRETGRPRDRVNDRESERPGDRETDVVTERPRDRESKIFIYIDENNYRDIAKVDLKNKPENLTVRQYCVLHWIYFNRPFKVESTKGIGKILNMGSNNAKNQINSLFKKGYIYKPFSINDGVNKGSTCRVVERLCLPLFGPTNIVNPEAIPSSNFAYPSPGAINQVTERPSDRETGMVTEWTGDRVRDRYTERPRERERDRETERPSALNSSSSLLNKPTTKTDEISLEMVNNELNHPELKYWVEQKLKPQHIKSWMNEFNLPLTDILESLKHCRFEIIDNGLKIRKTPFDCVYARLKKAGFYHAPAGYKSHEQKIIDRENERQEKAEKTAEKLRNARLEREQAEFDLAFEKLLSDPKGKIYKLCYDELNDFEKKMKGMSFTNAMKRRYQKIYDDGTD